MEYNRIGWNGMEQNGIDGMECQAVCTLEEKGGRGEEGRWQGAGLTKSRSFNPVILKL